MYAIHGPNAAMELAMLTNLQGLDSVTSPALPALLSCKPDSAVAKSISSPLPGQSVAEVACSPASWTNLSGTSCTLNVCAWSIPHKFT